MSDLISRDDLYHDMTIKHLELYEKDLSWSEFIRGFNFAMEFVKNLPSIEPEQKWIPVSEALPKDMGRILVTIVRSDGEKRVRSGHYYKGYFMMMDNGDTWNETDKEILAWMPFPEPWRGE